MNNLSVFSGGGIGKTKIGKKEAEKFCYERMRYYYDV